MKWFRLLMLLVASITHYASIEWAKRNDWLLTILLSIVMVSCIVQLAWSKEK